MPTTDADAEIPEDQLHLFPPPPAAPRRGVSPATFVATAVAAAVLAVIALISALLFVHERGKTDTSGDRTQISTTAARLAEAITAIDEGGNHPLGGAVEQLGTAPVIDQDKAISSTMGQAMTQFKLKSIRGTVKEVYVGDIDNAQARVIVRLDLVFVGDNTRVIPDQYLDMTLAKLDGTWKVDNVQVLNVALAGGAPTTTTTPAGSSSPG